MSYLFTFREILNLAKEFGRSLPRKHLIPRYFNIDRYARQKYGLISMCILSFDTNTRGGLPKEGPREIQDLKTCNLCSKQGCSILREISSLSSCWPGKSFRVQTVEDLGINSLGAGRFKNCLSFNVLRKWLG